MILSIVISLVCLVHSCENQKHKDLIVSRPLGQGLYNADLQLISRLSTAGDIKALANFVQILDTPILQIEAMLLILHDKAMPVKGLHLWRDLALIFLLCDWKCPFKNEPAIACPVNKAAIQALNMCADRDCQTLQREFKEIMAISLEFYGRYSILICRIISCLETVLRSLNLRIRSFVVECVLKELPVDALLFEIILKKSLISRRLFVNGLRCLAGDKAWHKMIEIAILPALKHTDLIYLQILVSGSKLESDRRLLKSLKRQLDLRTVSQGRSIAAIYAEYVTRITSLDKHTLLIVVEYMMP